MLNNHPAFRIPSPFSVRPTSGLTLVELMVVVAVIGVLAAISSVAYSRYMVKGQLTEMTQYAMDVMRGQQQYFARNSEYFEPTANYTSSLDLDSTNGRQWTNLLEFDAKIDNSLTIQVEANIGGNCGICSGIDTPDGTGDTNQAWFAILVTHDSIEQSVFVHNEMVRPVTVID